MFLPRVCGSLERGAAHLPTPPVDKAGVLVLVRVMCMVLMLVPQLGAVFLMFVHASFGCDVVVLRGVAAVCGVCYNASERGQVHAGARRATKQPRPSYPPLPSPHLCICVCLGVCICVCATDPLYGPRRHWHCGGGGPSVVRRR
mgnify:CR=1 FL=1